MKKIFLVIALLAIGLTVVSAQNFDEATAREMEQLANDFQAGKITLPEFQRRIMEIQSRVENDNQSAFDMARQAEQPRPQQQQQPRQQQQAQQQGQNAGWPPASAFQGRFKITPLSQPAGTTARYDAFEDRGVVHTLEIFITGGNANTALQNLKQQVERITGRQMSQEGNDYFCFSPDPNYRNGNIRFWLKLENNVVTLQIDTVAG